MKTLIVEDEFTSRLLLQELLKEFGPAHIAVDGEEAVSAVRAAMDAGEPYELICLDIMMPRMDGQAALKEIRAIEESRGIISSKGARIIMTTALKDLKNVSNAYKSLCDDYLVKPISREKLLDALRKFCFID
jgi:two-component system chemotaxis response regulator CheY